MNIGYIRVSSIDQNIGRQLDKKKQLGIEDRFLFIDKQSGKDFEREGYITMKKALREEDLVYIDALDRLAGIITESLKNGKRSHVNWVRISWS